MRKSSRTSDSAFASMDGKDIQNGGSQFYEGPFEKNMENVQFYITCQNGDFGESFSTMQ